MTVSRTDGTYQIPDDVLTAHLQGEAVLLDMASRRYFQLNETAAAVWKQLERGADRAALLEHVCGAFDVVPEAAGPELDRILAELAAMNLIRPASGPDAG
jgi:hypothetical protein